MTTTTNFGFVKLSYGDLNWHTDTNGNWDDLDTLLAANGFTPSGGGGTFYVGNFESVTLSTDQDNYDPTNNAARTTFLLNPTQDVTLTGWVPTTPSNGRVLILHNQSSTYSVTLAFESTSSVAANRFGFASSIVLSPKQSLMMHYSDTLGRWRAFNEEQTSTFDKQLAITGEFDYSFAGSGGISNASFGSPIDSTVINVTSFVDDNYITGIANGTNGQLLIIAHVAGDTPADVLRLYDENAASTAANRFTLGGENVDIGVGESALLRYDGSAARWMLVGGRPGTASRLYVDDATQDVRDYKDVIKTSPMTADVNDQTLTSASYEDDVRVLEFVPLTDRTLTGIAKGRTGHVVCVKHAGNTANTAKLTLKDNSGASTADNLFRFPEGDVVLQAGDSVLLRYNGAEWTMVASHLRPVTTQPGVFDTTFARTGVLKPADIAADQNNWDPVDATTSNDITDASVIRVKNTGGALHYISGMVAGTDGQIITIVNTSTNNVPTEDLVFRHENVSSAAANRFQLGRDWTVRPFESITLQYDTDVDRWIKIGASGCGKAWDEHYIFTIYATDGNTLMVWDVPFDAVVVGIKQDNNNSYNSSGTLALEFGPSSSVAQGTAVTVNTAIVKDDKLQMDAVATPVGGHTLALSLRLT